MKFKYRRYLLYYLARVAAAFVYVLPRPVGLWLAGVAGYAAYLVLPKYRNIAISNLRSAFGSEKTECEIRLIARRVFENLAKNGYELITAPKIDRHNIRSLVDIKNKEIFDKALEKGRGIIAITGHFGNWELIASTFKLMGYAGAVVGRRIYFHKYDEFLNRHRRVHGVNIIYRDESPRKILKVLKDNGIMGILADQDVDSVDGVFVDFFGRKAFTPSGPVLLAKASGAQLIPIAIVRDGSRHSLIVENPVDLADTGDKEKDAVENTQRWSKVLESYIRKYPEQWVWIHKRWKTQPK